MPQLRPFIHTLCLTVIVSAAGHKPKAVTALVFPYLFYMVLGHNLAQEEP